MDIFKLHMELDALLKSNPELMELQMKISKNLAKFDTPESRMYYLSTELFDSFDLLKEKLNDLNETLKEL